MSQLSQAFSLAAELHASQVRKMTAIPYISHLMAVSGLVMEFGGDTDQAIAALLHDAVEDAPDAEEAIRRATLIRERFGDHVALIVQGCTDGTPDAHGRKDNWRTRKEAYLSHLQATSPDILLVSCADKLHNARAIVSDLRLIGAAVFERFTAGRDGTLWYYSQLAMIFGCKLQSPIAHELERTVKDMNALASELAPV